MVIDLDAEGCIMDGCNNSTRNKKNEIVQVMPENFDCYREALKALLWENMMRRYEAKKVDEEYFETKTLEMKEYLSKQKAVIFVYMLDERVLGCVWAYPKIFLDEKRLFVQLLQVHVENRGGGIGKQLLVRLEKYAKTNNYHAVDLIADANSDGAVRFYRREGYQIERLQFIKIL